MKTDKEVAIKVGIEALKTMRSGMTLEKAIEVITLDVKGSTKIDYDDWQKALKLGIEAMKVITLIRQGIDLAEGELLPGETKE